MLGHCHSPKAVPFGRRQEGSSEYEENLTAFPLPALQDTGTLTPSTGREKDTELAKLETMASQATHALPGAGPPLILP